MGPTIMKAYPKKSEHNNLSTPIMEGMVYIRAMLCFADKNLFWSIDYDFRARMTL